MITARRCVVAASLAIVALVAGGLTPAAARADERVTVQRVFFRLGRPPFDVQPGDGAAVLAAEDSGIDPDLLLVETPNQKLSCTANVEEVVTATYEGVEGGPYVLIGTDTEFRSYIDCNLTLRALSDGSSVRLAGHVRSYSVRDDCTNCAHTLSPGHDECLGGPGICDGTYNVNGDQLLTLYRGTWGSYPSDCFLVTAQKLSCDLNAYAYVPPTI